MPDIIDKIFSKFSKEKAPAHLRAAILDIPQKQQSKFQMPKVWRLAGIFLLLAIFIAGGVYYQYFSIHKISAAFELISNDSDAAGISPDSVFVLKSSKDITRAQVKKVLKINPEVDFEVKSEGRNRFTIRPLLKLSGNTIYQISIAEGVAERDYAWAFQVRAPFAAVSTFPRHQGTGVPINSSIEVEFNRENLQNFEKFFEISPKVEGKFELHNDAVVFLPAKPLKEKTIYTVTIRKGLSAKDAAEVLAEDIVFAFETAQTAYTPYNYFGFNRQLYYFPPSQQPTVQLYEYNMDFSNSEAAIYSFRGKDEFVQSYYQSRQWELGWANFYKQEAGIVPVSGLSKITDFKPQIIKFDYQTFYQLPDKLPVGYYLLDMKVGDFHRQAWILINDVSHYYSLTDSNGFVWAYEFSGKKTINNATVSYYDGSGQRRELGKTNAEGLAEFTVPDALKLKDVNAQDFGKPKFLEIAPAGQPPVLALVSAGWWYYYSGSGSQNDFWQYLSTDRFTYKLSDTIKFWGVVKGKSEDYKNQKAKVQLREGYYYYDYFPRPGFENQDRPLAETEVSISQFDTVSGQLSYQGLKPGTYQVMTLLNDQVISQVNVEVLAYVKPLYQVNATPSRQAVFAGESVDFNIKAQFYDGTGVGALKLNYSGYYGSRQLTGQVDLNSRGEGKLTITPEYQQNDYYPISLNLNFTPALVEEGDVNSQTAASVSVFGPRIYLQASQKYNNNNNFTITAKTNNIILDDSLDTRGSNAQYWDYIGNPAANAFLSAEVEKIEYLQIEEGTYYDPINKTSNPKYRYEERKSIVGNYSGTTNGNGEWALNLNLPKADRVYYKVNISGTDSLGHSFKTTVYPYYYQYYGSTYYPGAVSKASNRVVLSLGFEGGEKEYNRRFSIGEKVKLEAEALEGQQYLNGQTLFYRYGHKGIGRLLVTSGGKLEDTFESDFRPAVSYRAVVFGPYGFVESNTLLASYKQEDAELNIQIKPDKPQYRPGEQAKVEVEVKDKDGKTSSGQINLSLVDEAVFDVLPYYWQQDILQSLYQVDYGEPNAGASDFTPQELQQGQGGAEKGGCFLAGTQILLPDGKYKNIEDIKVGDVVLTRASEGDPKVLTSAIVQGISSYIVGDYLIINKNLKVTGEHKLFVNGKWLEAGLIKVGDKLQDKNGKNIIVNSIERALAPKTKVYNFNVGKYHTYFAGGVFAHNAEKGGGYRSEFLDTAYFESKTLDGGKASFEFKLPDNITSWRATVSAFDNSKIFAGQTSEMIVASLPFFTDAVISENYLLGDKPIVVARAFGNSFNANNDTIFTLDIDALNFHQTKTVKGGQVDFSVPELSVGNYELKLKAKQGNMEDGILRKFSVVESYFKTAETKSIPVSSGQKGLTNEASGFTYVTFTDAGKARFYNQLVWNQYQYGKRADQVTVSFLAQKILKDYFGSTEQLAPLDLGAYHVPNGGIGLFTYGDSDLELSAELADLVPDQVYQPQLIQYFKTTMRDEKADIHRIARSLYGLAALHQPVLAKLQIVKDEPDLNLQDQMYIALAFAKLGDKEGARSYYFEHIRPQLHFEGNQAWLKKENDQTKRVKLSSLAGAVAAATGFHDDALAVWEYAQEHYPRENLDILERLMILREEISRLDQNESAFSYELNGKKTEVKLENGQSKALQFSKDELAAISFSDVKGKPVALITLEQSQNPDKLTKNSQLNISRSFWVNGKQTNEVREGDSVIVRLEYQIAKDAIDGGYQVVDFLPSGLRAVSNLWQRGYSYAYAQCYQKGEPLSVEGNKVYFSAYHSRDYPGECGSYTIEYYARAAAKGEFNVNPPLIQSLKNYESLNIGDKQKLKILAR